MDPGVEVTVRFISTRGEGLIESGGGVCLLHAGLCCKVLDQKELADAALV